MLSFHRLLSVASVSLLWLGPESLCPAARAAGDPSPVLSLTQSEKDAGWRLLFDGVHPDQWRGFGQTNFPAGKWNVEDGCLHLMPRVGGVDLVSAQKFDNFELAWEWRIVFGGNSGLKYLINEEHGPVGPEYQMIDDLHASDGARGSKWITASLYDVLPATNVVTKPLAEFNQSRLVVRDRHVEHWLNGTMVVSYELESAPLKAAISKSKFKTKDFYGVKVPGRILLQNHGAEVWFRNLKIRELPAADHR
jgi:hypothetical protein